MSNSPARSGDEEQGESVKVVVVIPARYGSTRLPGKPLARVAGRPIIQHVYDNAARSRRAAAVVVATDDERIASTVRGFGGQAYLTSPGCASGTDRVAEVVRLRLPDAEILVNVQGDEPELQPEQIDLAIEALAADGKAMMSTLAVPMADPDVLASADQVKVVVDRDGNALYFSRAPIPYLRDGGPLRFLKHLGVYAYRRAFLLRLAELPPTDLETREKLEQLRVLEHGYRIKVALTNFCPVGIDTPADLERFRRKMEK